MSVITEEPQAAVVSGNGHAARTARVEPVKKTGKRNRVLVVLVLVAMVGIAAGAMYWVAAGNYETTDDAYIEGHVVPISAQIAARVSDVHIVDNQLVHKGDLLIELDPTEYQQGLGSIEGDARPACKADWNRPRARCYWPKAQRDEAQAEVAVAQTAFDNADSDLKRYESLDPRARSIEQYDNATASQKSAKAQVDEAAAKLVAAQTQIDTSAAAVISAQGDVDKAQADVHSAETNLSYCRIVAPEDGRITRKNVEPGAYVTSGANLFALVPSDVWVVANFKETQLDQMRPGQKVTITIDAYPGKTFTGTVDSIQAGTGSRFSMLPAENATGNFVKVVQRVPVKIDLDPGQKLEDGQVLSPGMSVEPKVQLR